MDKQSDMEFLRDQVTRLNGVLSYYQEKYMEQSDKMGPNSMRTENNENTAPLLIEYDRVIAELTRQVHTFQSDLKQEQERVIVVINENESLWKQLKDQPRLSKSSDHEELIANLESQLQFISKEKNHLEQLLDVSESELTRLQARITEYDLKPETVIFQDQMEALRQQYLGSMHALESEVASLRDINRDLHNEVEKTRLEKSDIEKKLGLLEEKLRLEKQLGEENLSQLRSGMGRLDVMDNEKRQLRTELEELRAIIRGHEHSRTETEAALGALQAQYNDKQQQIFEASKKVTEAYQLVDNALADKRTLEIREQQIAGECERLRSVISGILDDAGARAREEVDLVRGVCEQEIERLKEELTCCEESRQQLVGDLDRLKRTQSELERELELVHREHREHSASEQSAEQLVLNRAIKAELERDETRVRLQAAESRLARDTADWHQQKEALDNERGYLEKKLATVQMSCDAVQSNADRLSKLLSQSEDSALRHRNKHQESLRNCRHEYELLKQASQIKQQELETRLSSSEEIQRHTTSEMRQFLAKQQQLSAKWREEAHNLSDQYEEKLANMARELDKHRKKGDEVVLLLQESKQHILENQELIEEQKKTIARLEKRLEIADDSHCLKTEVDWVSGTEDPSWQLQQLKKQQQQQIRESVARKYHLYPAYNT